MIEITDASSINHELKIQLKEKAYEKTTMIMESNSEIEDYNSYYGRMGKEFVMVSNVSESSVTFSNNDFWYNTDESDSFDYAANFTIGEMICIDVSYDHSATLYKTDEIEKPAEFYIKNTRVAKYGYDNNEMYVKQGDVNLFVPEVGDHFISYVIAVTTNELTLANGIIFESGDDIDNYVIDFTKYFSIGDIVWFENSYTIDSAEAFSEYHLYTTEKLKNTIEVKDSQGNITNHLIEYDGTVKNVKCSNSVSLYCAPKKSEYKYEATEIKVCVAGYAHDYNMKNDEGFYIVESNESNSNHDGYIITFSDGSYWDTDPEGYTGASSEAIDYLDNLTKGDVLYYSGRFSDIEEGLYRVNSVLASPESEITIYVEYNMDTKAYIQKIIQEQLKVITQNYLDTIA